MTSASPARVWRLGIIGLGVAGRSAAAAAAGLAPRVSVTRASDADLDGLRDWTPTPGLEISTDPADVCTAEDVDVVFVASPTSLHLEHAELAARNGKHVMIEKPMAGSVAECERIVEAGRASGVQIMAVHTPSYEAPLRTARVLIASGDVGAPLHLTQLKYVPWLERPRLAHEYDNAQGGGVINRQAPHQIDVAMYLSGGVPETVHAVSGSHPRWPGTDGHYSAMITFSNGAVATLVFNGYGYYSSAALNGGIGEDGRFEFPGSGQRLRQLRGGAKADMRSGRIHEIEHGYTGGGMQFPQLSGWTLMSCEGADLILSPTSLIVHQADGTTEMPFVSSAGHLAEAFEELDESIDSGQGALHDGDWGRRIVQIVDAIRQSASSGRTVEL